MRLGLVSDSHGDILKLRKALRDMGAVDVVLHAGDFYEDSRKLQVVTGVTVVGVMGNCDHFVAGPLEKVVEVAGKRILLTHGHQYGVKRDKNGLRERGSALGVNAVVFGHTHIAETFWAGGMLFVNPGSCRYGRSNQGLTYGTLDIAADGTMMPVIHSLGPD
ncbi:MAG: metallophosphoesterase [Firmicutes bacterium]|nr:metallophosphoesterase [Bacillota bacterium]